MVGSLAILVLGLAAGAGGYAFGKSTGENLDLARNEGEQAGAKRGAAVGARKGFAAGLKSGRDDKYSEAYEDAYRKANAAQFEKANLDPPKKIDVPKTWEPGEAMK